MTTAPRRTGRPYGAPGAGPVTAAPRLHGLPGSGPVAAAPRLHGVPGAGQVTAAPRLPGRTHSRTAGRS